MVEVPLDTIAGMALLDEAREAATHAYAPYTRFAVGAALLLADGSIVRGANLENASLGLSLCAEAAALAAANSTGHLRDVVAIGVIGGAMTASGGLAGAAPVRPCGRCRQMLHEAAEAGGRDIAIFCASGDGATVERFSLSALLPYPFGPGDVGAS